MDPKQKLVKKVATRGIPDARPYRPPGGLRPIRAESETSLGRQRTAKLVNRGYTYEDGWWVHKSSKLNPKPTYS